MSDYHTEVGGKVVCYRGHPMWTLADADNGKMLCEHLRETEAKVARLHAEVALWKERYDGTTEGKMHREIYGIPKEPKR